ncbi:MULTISPECIES: restriction endonuclease [unclassified Mesotoga]|uniref:restriction endonuclease n=1 Tax=unclassified Mesotoga TaxID=1184398 RepID=UPI000DA66AFD|nr:MULTISPECIES: restriction endonuclease [unclassified Mesotoga]
MILHYFRKYWWVVSAAIIALAYVIPYQVVIGLLFAQVITVSLVSFRIRNYSKPERNVKNLRNLLVLEFKDLLESYGISCDFPPRGDYSSVDLIADIFGEKTVFSIREGNDEIHKSEVQSLVASLSKHGAKRGVILVDGLLPIEAKRLAESYGLEFKRYEKYKEEIQEELGSQPNLCHACGKLIDQNQKELCRSNSELLGGKLYCHEHFKEIIDKSSAETI